MAAVSAHTIQTANPDLRVSDIGLCTSVALLTDVCVIPFL